MQVIESKIEGRETVEIEPAEEPTKLVDLMAALQASVNKPRRRHATPRAASPVSVAEAKEKRAAKTKTAAKAAKAARRGRRRSRRAPRPTRKSA
jgi:DNA end-binding protein Ku